MALTDFNGTGTTSSQDPGAAWPHGNQGSDVGVTGQPVGPAAVASQAGLKAAEHGAQSSEQASMANGASDSHGGKSGTLPAATTKALSDALVVLLKKHSVVNQTDIRCGLAACSKQHVGCIMKMLLRLHSCQGLEVAGHESCLVWLPVICTQRPSSSQPCKACTDLCSLLAEVRFLLRFLLIQLTVQ